MANPLIPRAQVHTWSERIGEDAADHRTAITRLLKDQRRLSRFVEENAQSMEGTTGGVAVYLIGVILRMFDLAGGRLRSATWDDVRGAERHVSGFVEGLLPVDDGFLGRARGVERAQAHILDEALYALFVRDSKDEEQDLDDAEAFKVYMLMWVATEALDKNWRPSKGTPTEASYVHTPVDDAEAG